MTRPDMRPMGMGEVLDRSFQLLRRHLGTLFVTAVLGLAPLLVMYLSLGFPSGAAMSQDQVASMGGLVIVLMLVSLVTMTVSWAALTRQLDHAASGGPVSLADGLRYGGRAFFRVAGLGILIYAVGAALLIPAGMVAALFGGGASVFLGEGVLGVGITIAALVAAFAAAALLWAPMAFISLPALVGEGRGPIGALRRAHGLGKGGRWRIVATALLAWIVMMLPTVGIPFLFGFGMEMWTTGGVGTVTGTQLYLYQAVTFAVGGLTTPFMVAVMVLTYYDRRVRREGYDVELASEAIPQNA
ncbi:MAG: hypothetical protein GWM90_01975 [Gemmatimonadetes bacterium]|nr:hypothetical protein [Gemmatimonadota bacterium]NIQ52386.1 hypothetical protein [Gemmatimonadota bacterium]NIU72505.1 hypothetical protein [Gammaproteobacteria bacterium]NIX42937.1 hypothetical protein [Gemmatimonadota bacterium]NIY07118.1 hypothetical protein [Gemmatimonadota bacterium]